ncbi:YceI family protein [Bacteroidia bacterium]|nr:YceI family protein [Bacteroidia bacterium]MDB9882023.1 YceI family protein [Bacteroidia bacterium]
MKKLNILITFSLLSIIAFAAIDWTPTSGSVKFYIKNTGITVDGSLSGIKSSIKFDENDLENSNIYASVNVSTINTGIGKRDEHVKGEEYFDAENYPKIEMKSTSFTKTNKGFNGVFKTTIKGKTKSINVPFTFTTNGETGKFVGSLNLDRLDYGVGKSSFLLSNDVKVRLTLSVKKK